MQRRPISTPLSQRVCLRLKTCPWRLELTRTQHHTQRTEALSLGFAAAVVPISLLIMGAAIVAFVLALWLAKLLLKVGCWAMGAGARLARVGLLRARHRVQLWYERRRNRDAVRKLLSNIPPSSSTSGRDEPARSWRSSSR
jgi:hypothetical protein